MHVLTTTSFIITNNCKLCSWRGMQISLLMDTHSIERSLTWIRKTTVVVSLSQIEWQLGKNKVLSEKGLSTLGPLILKRNNERKKVPTHPLPKSNLVVLDYTRACSFCKSIDIQCHVLHPWQF